MTEQSFNLVIPYVEQLLSNADWYGVAQVVPAGTRPDNAKNIRLDYEYNSEEVGGLLTGRRELEFTEEVKQRVIKGVAVDIADLIVNGDVEHPNDPLLKTFDGEVKLGKRFERIEISPIKYHIAYRTMKDTWELTMFVAIAGVLE